MCHQSAKQFRNLEQLQQEHTWFFCMRVLVSDLHHLYYTILLVRSSSVLVFFNTQKKAKMIAHIKVFLNFEL